MKKSKLSLIILLVVSMMLSMIPAFTVQAALGSQSFAFSDNTVKRSGAMVVKGVDFDKPISRVDLYARHGISLQLITVRLDSTIGPVIGTLELSDHTGYTSYSYCTNSIPITTDAKGLHDVYFCVGTGEYAFHNATFYYFEGSTALYKPYGETSAVDSSFENAHKINFLASLGIMDTAGEGFDVDVPVSRIEYLKALSGFYDTSELPEVPVGIFMDIDDMEDRQIAYFMYLKGAIVLEDTGYLKPHVYLTPQEAAEYAANMLGYPGDLKVITKLKAGKTHADGYMRPAQMADILYNAAFHDYRVGYKTKSGALWYEEYDKFFLNYTKGYEMGEGVVDATSYTSIYSADDSTADFHVRINNTDYAIGDTNADEFLGVYSYYVYETDAQGIETIKAIAPKFPDYITELDSSLTFTEISSDRLEYMTEKGKTEEIKLQASTKIIYNGKALDVEIDTIITNPANFRGKIIAIDNNRDKVCDTLVVMNAQSIVLNGVSEKGISSLSNSYNVNFEESARAEFVRNGKIANAVDFAKLECVDVYESASIKGTKLYKIVYSPNTIDSTLTGIGADNELSFEDGTVAKLSPYASSYTPVVGDTGTFYINSFGEVVYYTADTQGELLIGWIYKTTTNDYDEVAYASFMTNENKLVRHQFAERVYVDGVRCKDYSALKTALAEAKTYIDAQNTADGVPDADLNRPILYKLDENGFITVLDTINQKSSPITRYDSLKSILPSASYGYNGGYIWNGTNSDLSESIAFTNSKTIFFSISPLVNENDAFSTTLPGGGFDSSKNLSGYTYGVEDSRAINILASNTLGAGGGGGTSIKPFIITAKEQVVNSDGEVVTKFKGMSNDGNVECITSTSRIETDPEYAAMTEVLAPGDMMAAATLAGGVIDKMYACYFEDSSYLTQTGFSRTASNGVTIQSILRYTDVSVGTSSPDYDAGRWAEIKRLNTVYGGISYEYILAIGTVSAVGDGYVAINRINSGITDYKQDLASTKVIFSGSNGMDIDTTGTMSMLKPGQTVIYFINGLGVEAFYVLDSLN